MVIDAISKESRQEKMIGCLIVQPELQRDWIKFDFEVWFDKPRTSVWVGSFNRPFVETI